MDVANPKVNNRVDTIISSQARDNDIAKCKVATHLATAISSDNLFVMLALEQIQAAIVDDNSPTKQVKIMSHQPDD